MCKLFFHNKSTGLPNSQVQRDLKWNCPTCVDKSLPFAGLDETCLTVNTNSDIDLNNINKPSFTTQSLLGQKFDSADFLSNSISSKYYSPIEFLQCKLTTKFTMLHINIASLSKHIGELSNSLKLLDYPFDVIGITETRLYDDDPDDLLILILMGMNLITPQQQQNAGVPVFILSLLVIMC